MHASPSLLTTPQRIDPAVLQLAAVQFHLINTVILLLSREGFRRGCLRAEEVLALCLITTAYPVCCAVLS